MAKKRRTSRRARRQERQTNWVLIGGIIVGAVAVLGLLALALSEQTESIEDEPLSMVDYCDENPEACIVQGEPDAPVSVVEVSDYGCGHCRDFNLETAGLLEDLYVTPGDVQWVVLPFALRDETVPPARAAMCANEQGQFAEFHHELFERQDQLGVLISTDFADVVDVVGLDVEEFQSCFDSLRYIQTLQENRLAANEARVTGTPTFFVDGVVLEGNQPLTAFQQAINNALETANAN
ncbi:MAG: thioredoxin domain-containing protein [Candidatus Promineifilaceae bacterium]|nr:thioredoxin domain-containing protein [Candidatus Promineifilaceae bacterium]